MQCRAPKASSVMQSARYLAPTTSPSFHQFTAFTPLSCQVPAAAARAIARYGVVDLAPKLRRHTGRRRATCRLRCGGQSMPILSVFPALIVHSELKSVHPGFPVAFRLVLSTSYLTNNVVFNCLFTMPGTAFLGA